VVNTFKTSVAENAHYLAWLCQRLYAMEYIVDPWRVKSRYADLSNGLHDALRSSRSCGGPT